MAIIIEKPPLEWKDFKKYLKHRHKKRSLEDLIVGFHIKEDNCEFEQIASTGSLKAKKLEHGQSSKAKKNKPKKETFPRICSKESISAVIRRDKSLLNVIFQSKRLRQI